MGEIVVHAVNPNEEGPFKAFVDERLQAAEQAPEKHLPVIDLDPAGLRQTVFAAEEVEVMPDGKERAHVVGAMVCRWGMFGQPEVQEIVAPNLNGHTKDVMNGFASKRASLSDLTGLNF
jgi:hypothetical protein